MGKRENQRLYVQCALPFLLCPCYGLAFWGSVGSTLGEWFASSYGSLVGAASAFWVGFVDALERDELDGLEALTVS